MLPSRAPLFHLFPFIFVLRQAGSIFMKAVGLMLRPLLLQHRVLKHCRLGFRSGCAHYRTLFLHCRPSTVLLAQALSMWSALRSNYYAFLSYEHGQVSPQRTGPYNFYCCV